MRSEEEIRKRMKGHLDWLKELGHLNAVISFGYEQRADELAWVLGEWKE